jgi:hypothetical protein
MNPKTCYIFSVLFFLLVSYASAEPMESNLTAGVPTCFHIESSAVHAYYFDVLPKASEASFALNWRLEKSEIGMVLRSPDGESIDSRAGMVHEKGKTSESYLVLDLKSGRWILEVTSGNLTDKGEDYCISADLKSADSKPSEVQQGARFNGIFRDYLQNDSGETRGIVLAVGLDVLKAGDYSVKGLLYSDPGGKETAVEGEGYFDLGAREMVLDLKNISSSKLYEPSHVKELVLYDDQGEKIDSSFANYTTKAYSKDELAILSSQLTGCYKDHGSDINGDGLYDYLTVDVGVLIQETENYSLTGTLHDAQGQDVAWTVGFAKLSPGNQIIQMDFDGKSINSHKASGPYTLDELILSKGDSFEGFSVEDGGEKPYVTGSYNHTQFVDLVLPEKILSGSGSGEVLLTINLKSIVPVFQGRYSYDIAGINIPPISSNWTVIPAGGHNGYDYVLPGVYMPGKPNNFTIRASGVKNLGVGVKKDPTAWGLNYTRMWISSSAIAGPDDVAKLSNDLISPGRYQFKIFGDAAENTSQVLLEMEVVKKLAINGSFNLALNTSGFPSGNYSINALAINGSLKFDELNLAGPASGL